MTKAKERKTQLTAQQLSDFIAMYLDNNMPIADICDYFKRRPGTIYRWAFEYGLKRPKQRMGDIKVSLDAVKQFAQKVSRELPSKPRIEIAKPRWVGKATMEFILLLSDLHAGRITRSFDAEVFAARILTLAQRAVTRMGHIALHKTVSKLNIFSLGDMVTGERVGYQVTFEELEHAVLTQIYGICIPRLVQFTRHLIRNVPLIDVYAVAGNHGKVAKPSVSAANWDTVVNLGWQAQMAAQKEVTFDVADVNWYNTATVKGTDWLLTHGDAVRGGNPYNAIASKVNQWHQSIPEHFDKVAIGHFHHFNKIQEVYVNGTLLTDDDWSRQVVGRDGDCCQVLLAVSDYGIEAIEPIYLNDVTAEDYDG